MTGLALSNDDRQEAVERLSDFTMVEYSPLNSPVEAALSSAAVLGMSLEAAEVPISLREMASELRSAFGAGRTVWAAIDRAGSSSWEFYWYRTKGMPDVEPRDVIEVMGIEPATGLLSVVPPRPDVFSIDVGPELLDDQFILDALNVYVGNPAASVRSGYSYRFTSAGPTLSNAYYRFPRAMIHAVRAQLAQSLHVVDCRDLLWEDVSCDSLHVANKLQSDALYYGGLDVDAARTVLERTGSHEPIRSFLSGQASQLSHLRFDVGIDVVNGTPGYSKVAIYGLL